MSKPGDNIEQSPIANACTRRHTDACCRIAILPGLLVLAAIAGCSSFAETKGDGESLLKAPKMSDEAVVLEAAFVRLPESPASVWELLDESSFDADQRIALARNGLRAAKTDGALPTEMLPRAADAAADPLHDLEDAGVASPLSKSAKRLQCPPGRVAYLETRRPVEGKVELTLVDGDASTPHVLEHPEYLVAIQTRRRDDGTVGVIVEPVVRHGELKQTWVGQDQALRVGMRRSELETSFLETAVALSLGQSLILGSTEPPHGLGEQMWAARRLNGAPDRSVLIIRVVGQPGPAAR